MTNDQGFYVDALSNINDNLTFLAKGAWITDATKLAEGDPNFPDMDAQLPPFATYAANLNTLPLDVLPDARRYEWVKKLTRISKIIGEEMPALQHSDSGTSPEKHNALNHLVNSLRSFQRATQQDLAALLMAKGADEVARDLPELVKDAQVTFADILSIKRDVDNVLKNVREASGETGVSVHAKVFKDLADAYQEKKRVWLAVTIGLIVVALAAPFLLIGLFPVSGELSDVGNIQKIAGKVFFLSTLFFAIAIAARTYRSNAHLLVVTEHRHASLLTFQTFIAAAGDDMQTKMAILLETTRTIFAPSSTGFLPGEDDASPNQRIVEIMKMVKGS